MTTKDSPTGVIRSRREILKTGAVVGGLSVAGVTSAQANGATRETVDVVGQGTGGPVVAEDGATLRRTDNALQAKIKMPTPEPGEYDYPDPDENPTAAPPGHPEGFTLWMFVFDEEQGGYDPDDPDEGPFPWSSVFFVAGHMVGGPNLTLSGNAATAHESMGFDLENPRDVDVHLAVAPHGGLDPDIMPEQIQTPAGGPDMWWFAIFEAPE